MCISVSVSYRFCAGCTCVCGGNVCVLIFAAGVGVAIAGCTPYICCAVVVCFVGCCILACVNVGMVTVGGKFGVESVVFVVPPVLRAGVRPYGVVDPNIVFVVNEWKRGFALI